MRVMVEPSDKSESGAQSGPPPGPIPKAVASRLSLYLRELQHLIEQGEETTSSSQLGRKLGFTDAQVRKDLAYFGHFGFPGIGYRCDKLVGAIKRILGTDQQWSAALIGAGNLGRALLGYKGFGRQGFRVVAAFDTDPHKVGSRIEGVLVYDLADLEDFARANGVRLGILAVPSSAAQGVATRLAAAGVEGILNFAPVTIELPENVRQVGVDLAIELEQLSFAIVNRTEPPPGR
jgi:redox-sensing transcriptional repressor